MDSTFAVHSDSKMENYQCINVVASGHTAVNMSRHSLLQWINETLDLKIRKTESLCSGAVYCQLMDILFPGCIPLKKVKLDAIVMNEYWTNFKQLQIAFRAVGCEKDVPINRLIEGRFQENFEFLQWFKRFYDANAAMSPVRSVRPKQTEQIAQQPSSSKSRARPVAIVNPVLTDNNLEKKLKSQISKYQERAERVSEERNFYFDKLRRVEIMCTSDDALKIKKKDLVEKILAELHDTGESIELTET